MTVSTVCAALGDPTRADLVQTLARGPATLSRLAAPYAMSLTAVRKHIGVLESAGWVTRTKSGRVVTCALEPAPFAELQAWLTHNQAFWSGALDRLDAVL